MQQIELFPVQNPCVGVCQSNAKGYCLGCLRSRTERQKWNDMAPAEKMKVLDLCKLRRSKLEDMIKKKQAATQAKSQTASLLDDPVFFRCHAFNEVKNLSLINGLG